MKVCEMIARWCQDIGTPFVAGIPGNGILEIIDKLETDTDVPFILTRHEQGASMMAYSYAFQTKNPAVVVGSKAPGATNLSIGVMGAFVESLPMMVITAQVSNAHEGYEAFEEIDLAALFKPITKWSVQVNNPSRTLEILNEAYRITMSGRPGPVHVAIPYNFMQLEAGSYVRPTLPTTQSSLRNEVSDIVHLLDTATRPVVIVGGGLPPTNAVDVLAIADTIGAPIVESWLRKPIPDRHPLCVGMAGIGGSPAAQHAIHDADVALVLGCRFSEQMTEHYTMNFAPDAKLIHIDVDPGVIGRVYPVHLGVQANLQDVLPELREAVQSTGKSHRDRGKSDWLQSLQREQLAYLESLAAYTRDDVSPQGRYVVQQLRELLDDDTHLVLDSGNYLHWAEQYFSVNQPGLFHYPTSGTMGFGIPGAIGAKIAFPDLFVCALVGDGGFAMTMGELETALRIGTPILVVIINNGTLGHIRVRQEVNFHGRCVGVNFSEQHFAHVAEAFGAYGVEVNRTSEVRGVLTDAISAVRSGRCAVVDVHVSSEMADAPIVRWWSS
ncbi:thiamine pyrophosphate-binding protein [Alicyclobacillus mengziensis]|uniref:Thiamine pyrophosphate-binding protein n=1 Tax=Alicyclobacillus mengziensis TaxID=2931921 RepID=A0A9X7W2R2_9BACL|nr:thiamine pyrophosphate-binding protein [Alicyclobacillus mengziensis]QSO49315.1 thiamine pyrophosphate-binding protein [Alicyclobacillus mengziensis]